MLISCRGETGVINIIDKHTIIKLWELGKSTRQISVELGLHRKTVTRYLTKHKLLISELEKTGDKDEITMLQEQIISPPKYEIKNRNNFKYTKEIDDRIDQILYQEDIKNLELGTNKQKLTILQIHEILVSEGYDIGKTTVGLNIKKKRSLNKEVFIKQEYEYGDRVEFDYGEIKLLINGVMTKFYLAVFTSPASKYRYAYLYTDQSKNSFMDAHVKFFEMIGGVYREVVYDNMRNVVTRFIGKNEKLLNEDLLKMSIYYGFNINVTNCFKGNEKGSVENSVKFIRNKAYAKKYKFSSFNEAKLHLENILGDINKNCDIELEKKLLLPYKPKLEIGFMAAHRVDKYSFIRVDNNFYSVPEFLCGRTVNVKKYIDRILIYSNATFVCRHELLYGFNEYCVDILHYLNTLKMKPGALSHSKALDSNKILKNIYHKYYTKQPKLFIDLLLKHKEKSLSQIEKLLIQTAESPSKMNIEEINELESSILSATVNQLKAISEKLEQGDL